MGLYSSADLMEGGRSWSGQIVVVFVFHVADSSVSSHRRWSEHCMWPPPGCRNLEKVKVSLWQVLTLAAIRNTYSFQPETDMSVRPRDNHQNSSDRIPWCGHWKLYKLTKGFIIFHKSLDSVHTPLLHRPDSKLFPRRIKWANFMKDNIYL